MGRTALDDEDLRRLKTLRTLVLRARRSRRRWRNRELVDFPRLYRHACTTLARLEARADDPRLLAEVRRLVGSAHGIYHRERARGVVPILAGAARLLFVESPRTIRAEWRLLTFSFVLLYGLAGTAYVAVGRDLDLASSLLPPAMVEQEIQQLEATAEGQPFRGNFTFGLGQSPRSAGWIMVHNMGVGMLFFASALIPPIYLVLVAVNALLLGTYTAVAGHWGQAGAISSILWCHGVIEIQAFVLAGSAGLCLVRAWFRPGPWSRRHALQIESRRAWRMLAPVFPMLVLAGTIEAFVSPHAPFGVRVGVAVSSAVLLFAWVAGGPLLASLRAAR